MAHGKRYKSASETVDRDKTYPLEEAVKIVKANAKAKFDETIEVAMNLGVDPRHADQAVRGMIELPNGTAEERQQQQRVKSIATSWTLQPGDVPLLDHVAGELLWRHPCFRALVAAIGLQGRVEADAVPNTRCPVQPPPAAGSKNARPPA